MSESAETQIAAAMEQVAGQTVVINGKTYLETALPEQVRKLIEVYRRWVHECNEAKLEVSKCEAALRSLSNEIASHVEHPASAAQQAIAPAADTEVPAAPAAANDVSAPNV